VCVADGCDRKRCGPSRFCHRHRYYISRHGHLEGRAIKKRELKPHIEKATAMLAKYSERPDVVAALKWLDIVLVSKTNDGTDVELERLRREGVNSTEVLRAALAVWSYHDQWPGSLPDDARLTLALGRAVVRLRNKRRVFAKRSLRLHKAEVAPAAFRTIGLLLREALGILLARLVKLHEKDRQQDEDLRRAIRSGDPSDPFDILIPTRPR
jgi:hypothetical protein